MNKYEEAEQRGIDDYFAGIRYPKDCPFDTRKMQDAWNIGQAKARLCDDATQDGGE